MTTTALEQRARDALASARTAYTDIHYLDNPRAAPYDGVSGPLAVIPVARVSALAIAVVELGAIVVELAKQRPPAS